MNPQKADFLRTIDEAIAHLAQYRSNLDWDGGGLILVYAGHGTEHTGAIVFPNNELLEPEELARYLARRMPKSHRRLRVDLFFDSCFASVFVAHFLAYAWSELEDFLFPCTFFAADCENVVEPLEKKRTPALNYWWSQLHHEWCPTFPRVRKRIFSTTRRWWFSHFGSQVGVSGKHHLWDKA